MGKFTNMWKLDNTCTTNESKKEIKRKIKIYLETKENVHTTYQNLWEVAKISLRGKFIMINTYVEKIKRSQINKLTLYFKELDKKENTKFQIIRMKK